MHQPEKFLELRVHDLDLSPGLSGLCVGYELGSWRDAQFVDHVIEWLPEFALTYSEIESIHSGNLISLIREASRKVYMSEKFKNRGEFGELFLHIAIRQVFGSLPVISKIYYKSSTNETVKGFDAVHVVEGKDGLEIWLGEAKFYSEIKRAIRDVVAELQAHMERDYLRDEFVLIKGKIDGSYPHADEVKTLLSPNTSLDDVFKRVCLPVLLTYDSDCVKSFSEVSAEYNKAFMAEINECYLEFSGKGLPGNVTIHLFLMPLKSKVDLVAALDEKLKGLQSV